MLLVSFEPEMSTYALNHPSRDLYFELEGDASNICFYLKREKKLKVVKTVGPPCPPLVSF